HIASHPVITHKMNTLRSVHTGVQQFRDVVSELTMLLSYEATRNLPVTTCRIQTPLAEMTSTTLEGADFVITPILRAGLGMVSGMIRIFPEARIAHIGIQRDEKTAEPVHYYK